jgi:hypothetical protein
MGKVSVYSPAGLARASPNVSLAIFGVISLHQFIENPINTTLVTPAQPGVTEKQ